MIKPVVGLVVLPTKVTESPKEERKSEKTKGIARQNNVIKKFALKLIRSIFLFTGLVPSELYKKEILLSVQNSSSIVSLQGSKISG